MSEAAVWIGVWLSAYLLGGVPFGLLIGKLKGVDIRDHGSGNIGATNAMRVLGKGPGIVCFLLDVLKGAVPVSLAGLGSGLLSGGVTNTVDGGAWLGVGVACVLGHLFSPYLGFKGGKGVATGFGVYVSYWGVTTLPTLAALATWIILVRLTKYVSVASIGAALMLPLGTALLLSLDGSWGVAWPFGLVTAIVGTFVVVKHRSNIARLRDGTESKVGTKGSQASSTLGRDELASE